jgi:CHASE2 domain-containing sensor protein
MKVRVKPRRPKPRPRLKTAWGSRFNFTIFAVNLLVFFILSLVLQYSRQGQEALDVAYDYLIRKNFQKAVLTDSEHNPVSPELKLVLFEDRDYKQSYTKGYWTPRDEVGLAILNSLKRGAKIVLVDFSFAGEAPMVMEGEQLFDGTKKFLASLTEAAELARAKKSVILVPAVSSPPPKGYLELLARYRDVFQLASFEALHDEHDGKVRRLSWFSCSGDDAPILSAALTAALLLDQEYEAAMREAKAFLVGDQSQAKLLSPALANALRPEEQKSSSRLIYRLLPRTVVAREFGSGPDISKGIVWRPQQIASANLAEPDFNGKIVLIGSDYQENCDYHQTAFGPLAGSYILANGINMVLTGRMIEEAKAVNLALLIFTGLLTSVLYARFSPYGLTSLFFLVSLSSPWLSAWAFNRYGVFLDVWLPALGVSVCNTIVRIAVDTYNTIVRIWANRKLYFGQAGLVRLPLRRRK